MQKWEERSIITGQFGLRVQNEAGQRLTEFCQESMPDIANTLSNNPTDSFMHGYHQMVSIKIRLIMFAAEDGEALYSQQKQDLELTVAHIMSSLLENSGLNGRK